MYTPHQPQNLSWVAGDAANRAITPKVAHHNVFKRRFSSFLHQNEQSILTLNHLPGADAICGKNHRNPQSGRSRLSAH
jgi:hypothetical protein